MLKYEDLKHRPKELLAATGLNQAEFEALLVTFETVYSERYSGDKTVEGQVRQRRGGAGRKGSLVGMADKLLFVLVYEKTYPLQTMHGLQFGLSQSRVNEWLQRLLPVLQQALKALAMTPERDGAAVETSQLVQEGGSDLVIDGTERRRERPQNEAAQQEHYSGKKKLIPTKTWS